MGLEGEARELYAEGRRLGVDAMRATHTHGLHVFARARLQRLHDGVRAREDDLAHGAQLQGQGGVEHVRGGQAEVDPAPARASRFGKHVNEGSHVVLGHELPLAYRLHREARRADRLQLSRRRPPARAEQLRQLLARRDLDRAPALHAGLIGPQAAELGAGVAGDHAPPIMP